jgi:hypothetical protein
LLKHKGRKEEKKRNKANNKGSNNKDETKVSQKAAPLDLSRLLAALITIKKTLHHRALSRPEESV